MHLKFMKSSPKRRRRILLVAIAGGARVSLFDYMGNAWTANDLKIAADAAVDLRSDIIAEARAKIVYERLISFTQNTNYCFQYRDGVNVTRRVMPLPPIGIR
jgi:Mn-containing catalase